MNPLSNYAENADLLNAELGSRTKFPMEALPKVIRDYVKIVASSIPCPPDYIAVPLLTACGAVVGRTRMLEIKGGWRESTLLWTVVVGRPGTAKSPAFKFAIQSLSAIESKLKTFNRLMVIDTTIEALAPVLEKNPRGLILARDELAGWMNSMNQYKRGSGSDEENYLSTWNCGCWQIDRKGGVPIHIPEAYLALTGTVQPEILHNLLTNKRHEDGLASRLLICYPEEMRKQLTEDEISDSAQLSISELLNSLFGSQFANNGQPVIIYLSDEGYKAFKEVLDEHTNQYERYGIKGPLRAHWSKLEGYIARIALIIHMVRYYYKETCSQNVDADSIYMAASIVDYFKSHAIGFYGTLIQMPSVTGKKILDWAVRHKLQKFDVRTLLASKIVGNKQEAEIELDKLEKLGSGKWDVNNPKQDFILNLDGQSASQQIQQSSFGKPRSKWLDKLNRSSTNPQLYLWPDLYFNEF